MLHKISLGIWIILYAFSVYNGQLLTPTSQGRYAEKHTSKIQHFSAQALLHISSDAKVKHPQSPNVFPKTYGHAALACTAFKILGSATGIQYSYKRTFTPAIAFQLTIIYPFHDFV